MLLESGSATLVRNDRKTQIRKGDIIYFRPNSPYRILNDYGDFSVINLFFDYTHFRDETSLIQTLFDCNFNHHINLGNDIFSDTKELNNTIHTTNFIDGDSLIRTIYIDAQLNKDYSQIYVDLLLYQLLILFYRFLIEHNNAKVKKIQISNIIEFINENNTEKLTAATLGKQFHYHPYYINKLIKEATGISLHKYVTEVKIKKAIVLLRETDMSIAEIAQYLSFFDSSHFSNAFHLYTLKSPSKFKQEIF